MKLGDYAFVIHEGKLEEVIITAIRETHYGDPSYNGHIHTLEYSYDIFSGDKKDNIRYKLYSMWKPADQFAVTKEELIESL